MVSRTGWVMKRYSCLEVIHLETHTKSVQAGEMKAVWLLKNGEVQLSEETCWHQSMIYPFFCRSEVSFKDKDIRNHLFHWSIFYFLFKE